MRLQSEGNQFVSEKNLGLPLNPFLVWLAGGLGLGSKLLLEAVLADVGRPGSTKMEPRPAHEAPRWANLAPSWRDLAAKQRRETPKSSILAPMNFNLKTNFDGFHCFEVFHGFDGFDG